jgi:hypothetical protein
MSMYHDYTFTVLARQKQTELMAQADQDRLARLVPRARVPWWRRLLASRPSQQSEPLAGWRVQLPR